MSWVKGHSWAKFRRWNPPAEVIKFETNDDNAQIIITLDKRLCQILLRRTAPLKFILQQPLPHSSCNLSNSCCNVGLHENFENDNQQRTDWHVIWHGWKSNERQSNMTEKKVGFAEISFTGLCHGRPRSVHQKDIMLTEVKRNCGSDVVAKILYLLPSTGYDSQQSSSSHVLIYSSETRSCSRRIM